MRIIPNRPLVVKLPDGSRLRIEAGQEVDVPDSVVEALPRRFYHTAVVEPAPKKATTKRKTTRKRKTK